MAGSLLFEVGTMFAAIGVVTFLSTRANLSPIPFYILVGIAMNEHVLGQLGLPPVTETTFVSIGAELGIVFLLFFLGLEFNLDRLYRDRERIGKAGLIDLGINFTAGLGLGYVLFGGVVPAIVTAGIVYISSSAVISKTMLDIGWIANPESSPILGVLVFEDLVIAIYLALVSAVVLGGGSLSEATRAVGVAFGFLVLLLLLVYFGTSWFDRMLDVTSSEFFILRTLGTLVLISGAALAVGVSEAVAAFFVGMAFSSTSFVHELEETLSPLRDTFAAVFFFWIGLLTDPFSFLGVLDLILVAVLVSVPAKVLSGFLGGRTYGLDERRSLRVGFGLVTRGEFSLIIAATAVAGAGTTLGAATANEIYLFTVGYVLVMSLLGTVLMQTSPFLERRLLTR